MTLAVENSTISVGEVSRRHQETRFVERCNAVANGSTRQEFSPGTGRGPAAKSSVSFVDGQTGLLEVHHSRLLTVTPVN